MRKEFSSISSTQLVRDLPSAKSKLIQGPVKITSHGRVDAVMISDADFNEILRLTDSDAEGLDAKLRIVLNSISTLVLIVDNNFKIRRANRAFASYFNYNADSMPGLGVEALNETPTDHYIFARMKTVLESGIAETFELPSTRRPGRTLAFHIAPWPRGVALFADDVSDRNVARDRVLRMTAMDIAISQIPGVAVGNIDGKGVITTASQGLVKILGGTMESVLGVSIFTILDRKDREKIEKAMAAESTAAQIVKTSYLYHGMSYRPGTISLSRYQTSTETAAFAIALHDPDLCHEELETEGNTR